MAFISLGGRWLRNLEDLLKAKEVKSEKVTVILQKDGIVIDVGNERVLVIDDIADIEIKD